MKLLFSLLILIGFSQAYATPAVRCIDYFLLKNDLPKVWVKETLTVAIQKLHAANIPLNAEYLKLDPDRKIFQFLTTNKLSQYGSLSLRDAGVRLFGSWDKALEAAGVSLGWNKQNIISTLQLLNKNNISLNATSLRTDSDGSVGKLLVLNNISTKHPNTLYNAAISEFKSWDEALKAAGLNVEQAKKPNQPILTKDTVAEIIKKMNQAGILLTAGNTKQDKDGKVLEILKQNNFLNISSRKFYETAISLYGSWDDVLTAVQIRAADVYKPRGEQWTADRIIDALKKMDAAEISLVASKFYGGDNSVQTDFLISTGLSKTGSSGFYQNTERIFGSWVNALVAAEIDLAKYGYVQTGWSKSQIIDLMFAIKNAGYPLTQNQLRNDVDNDINKFLKTIKAKTYSGVVLYNNAVKLFGTWNLALEAAGYSANGTRPSSEFWSREDILLAIKDMNTMGISTAHSDMQLDLNGDIRSFLKENKRSIYGSTVLLRAAKDHFGSWRNALIAANINPDQLTTSSVSSWTKENITRAIKSLFAAQLSINAQNMRLDVDGKLKLHLQSKKLSQFGPNILFKAALRAFGSWDRALIYAGINPEKIIRITHEKWTQADIIAVIQKMKLLDVPLNYTNIQRDPTGKVKAFFKDNIDFLPAGQYSFLRAAVHLFKSWDGALSSAGLDPDAVRLSGSAAFQTLSVQLQKARRDEVSDWLQGKTGYVSVGDEQYQLVAVAKEDLENDLIRKELEDQMFAAINQLTSDNQILLSRIIEIIETTELSPQDYADMPNYLSRQLAESMGGGANEAAQLKVLIDELFKNIKENDELRDALFS